MLINITFCTKPSFLVYGRSAEFSICIDLVFLLPLHHYKIPNVCLFILNIWMVSRKTDRTWMYKKSNFICGEWMFPVPYLGIPKTLCKHFILMMIPKKYDLFFVTSCKWNLIFVCEFLILTLLIVCFFTFNYSFYDHFLQCYL